MMINPVESAFRARMKELAHKGGAVTKRRHGYDPRYYRDIGRRGGQASVAARKARIAADLNAIKPGDAPIFEPLATPAEAPLTEPIDTSAGTPDVTTRPPITIADVMADHARFGPYRAEVSERQSILDAIAQDSLARAISEALYPEPEPFDPWD
jgi:hypothetical protein